MTAEKPRKRKKGEVLSSPGPRISPAEAYVASLPGKYFRLSEVAKEVGVNQHTVRRLVKADPPRVNAPSYIGQLGKQQIYLFTEDDVEEIRHFYNRRYELTGKPGRKKE